MNASAIALPAPRPAAPPRRDAGPWDGNMRWRIVLLLVLVLPLFGQTFHYVKALPPLWALSKAFPLLSLPFALILFKGTRPVASRQMLLTFVWLVLAPTFIATSTFQQTFFVGLTAQVKLLPLLYFFSFLGMLRLLRPSLAEITAGFLICAVLSFLVLVLLWAIAPQSWYIDHYVAGDSPLLSSDSRGNRIRLPTYMALIGVFYCYRRFWAKPRLAWLALAAAGFGLVFGLVRTRSTVLGLAAMGVITAFTASGRRTRILLLALVPFAFAALFSVPYIASAFSTDRSSGFDVRWVSTVKAIDFLGTDPLRWLFGVGTLSPLDPAGLMTYFNHFFFLADITWVGIVFEFGVAGALLILAIPVRAFFLVRRARAVRDTPLLRALQDYLVYAVLISELNPMTLAPGEITVIASISVWLLERSRGQESAAGISA